MTFFLSFQGLWLNSREKLDYMDSFIIKIFTVILFSIYMGYVSL